MASKSPGGEGRQVSKGFISQRLEGLQSSQVVKALIWKGWSSAAIPRMDYKGQGQGEDTNKRCLEKKR